MSAKPEEIASSMSLGQAGLAGQNLVRKTSTCVGDILRAQPHMLYIASKFKLASEKILGLLLLVLSIKDYEYNDN